MCCAAKFFWCLFFMFIILFFFTCYGMTVVAVVPNIQVESPAALLPEGCGKVSLLLVASAPPEGWYSRACLGPGA